MHVLFTEKGEGKIKDYKLKVFWNFKSFFQPQKHLTLIRHDAPNSRPNGEADRALVEDGIHDECLERAELGGHRREQRYCIRGSLKRRG